MSTHAIVWFQDEEILDTSHSETLPAQTTGERRWKRVKIDVRVRVTFNVGTDTETVDGQGNDVSEGGMAIYFPADLSAGDNVQVEIIQRYGQPRIGFSARISNRNGFRYGLEFLGLEDEQRVGLVASITGTRQ